MDNMDGVSIASQAGLPEGMVVMNWNVAEFLPDLCREVFSKVRVHTLTNSHATTQTPAYAHTHTRTHARNNPSLTRTHTHTPTGHC
jgi:hypothetical protein